MLRQALLEELGDTGHRAKRRAADRSDYSRRKAATVDDEAIERESERTRLEERRKLRRSDQPAGSAMGEVHTGLRAGPRSPGPSPQPLSQGHSPALQPAARGAPPPPPQLGTCSICWVRARFI